MGKKSNATRARLINVAIRLFARNGFDSVSVRQITSAARANIGAVNYHFGSKEELIAEVFRQLAAPINKMRLLELDRYEKESGTNALDLERVVRVLIEPAVRAASDAKGGGFYLTRLLVLGRALARPSILYVLAEQYDVIFHRFLSALSKANPELSYEELCWRYDFTIGAMLHVVSYFDGTSRIKRITKGQCDTDDVELIINHLIRYVVAALQNIPQSSVKSNRPSLSGLTESSVRATRARTPPKGKGLASRTPAA